MKKHTEKEPKKHKPITDNIYGINQSTDLKKQSQFVENLHQIHRIFVQSISPRLNDFFSGMDDLFFDLAEQAENNTLQNQYFAGIGDIRKNKSSLIRQFAKNVNIIFQKFKSSDYVYFIENNQQTDETIKNLTLIKDDDLDQKLAVNNVVAKISQMHHKELHLLNQRFAKLAAYSKLNEHQNPIGPDAIINAFALSLQGLKSENNIKLMIIKLFEKNMVENLGPAYRVVNAYLKKQGVLPDIKFEIKHPKTPKQPINNSINYLAQRLSGEDENYKKIAEILDQDPNQTHTEGYRTEDIVQFSQLSDALDQIKSELFSEQELVNNNHISPLELKDELLKKLKSLKANTNTQTISQADENTIDLIGELFQFLVDDRNLPETIQLILSKLQLPFLQIALKDSTFFSDKQNNARQLLNIVAESAIGWSPQTDEKAVYITKVKELVDFILNNHEKNINYMKLITRFIKFDQKLKNKTSIIERRTSAKVSGRERLNHAKNKTARFLQIQLKNQKLPPLVRELLLKPWANVLVLSELRDQHSPGILSKHQNFATQLINAANPNTQNKLSEHEIESLCNELIEGFKLVAFDVQELSLQARKLKHCLIKINTLKSKPVAVEFIEPSEILKLSKQFNRESSVASLIDTPDLSLTAPKNIPIIEDEFNEKSLNIQLGEWLEINSKAKLESPVRVKLSWISPISGKLLFVNAKGAKVLDMFPVELAHKLRIQHYTLLQQIPLIDRAMSSIANKMKKK